MIYLRNMLKFNDKDGHLADRIKSVRRSYYVPPSVDGGLAVDVGANVGAFPLVYHKRFSRIICVEPSQESVNKILENTENLFNVEVYRYAAHDISGVTLRLHPYKPANYSGGASTYCGDDKYDLDVYEEVESISLEDVFGRFNIDRINYLKVDCEGAEVPFLLDKILFRVDNIGMELHWADQQPAKRLIDHISKTHDIVKRRGKNIYNFRIK